MCNVIRRVVRNFPLSFHHHQFKFARGRRPSRGMPVRRTWQWYLRAATQASASGCSFALCYENASIVRSGLASLLRPEHPLEDMG